VRRARSSSVAENKVSVSINGDDKFDIEMFPCSGLLAEGFRRAGIVFDMAIEIEATHCDSYESNLGHRPIHMDVRSFYQMLLDGWKPPRPVRFLMADPPCVSWSRGGKRLGLDDPRDMLEGTCRIIELLQPQIYLIGNVPGLDDGPNLAVVQRLIGGLSKHGYCTADFARLNAVHYGVPQQRIRPWWFGHRVDTPCIQWPEPTHADPDELRTMALPLAGVNALKPWITCRDALGHLTGKELGRPIKLRKRDCKSKQHGSVPEKPARVVGTSNLSDGNLMLFDDQPRAGKRGRKRDNRVAQGNRVGDLDEPAVTVTAKATRAGARAHSVFTLLKYDLHHPPSSFDEPSMTVRAGSGGGATRAIADSQGMRPVDPDNLALEWPWEIPSTTVLADNRLSPPGHHDEDYAIRSLPGGVVISEKAAAILQDFPQFLVCRCGRAVHERQWEPHESHCHACGDAYTVEPWLFAGKTKKARFSMLGQAMPAALAHAVGTSVMKQLDRTDRKDNNGDVATKEAVRPPAKRRKVRELRGEAAAGGSQPVSAVPDVQEAAQAVPR
jgi:site-specific DNA-cytosine methylase